MLDITGYFLYCQLERMNMQCWWNDTDGVQKLKNSEKSLS